MAGTPQRSALPGFAAGLAAPARGARFLLAHPGLARFLVLPWMFTLAAGGILGWQAWVRFDTLRDAVWTAPASAWLRPLHAAFGAVLALLVAAACALAAFLAGQILAAPVYTRMAMRVRRMVDPDAPTPASGVRADVLVPIRNQAWKASIFLGIQAGLLLLHIVPGAGTAAHLILSTGFSVFWLALSYLDFPLDTEPEPLGLRRRVAYVLGHPAMAAGLGTSLFAILLIPLAGLILLPVGVIGATLLHVEASRKAPIQPGEWR